MTTNSNPEPTSRLADGRGVWHFVETVYLVGSCIYTEAQFTEQIEWLEDTPRKQAAFKREAKRQVREYDVIFDTIYEERSPYGTQRHYNEVIHD